MQAAELRRRGGGLFNGDGPFSNLNFVAEITRWKEWLDSLGIDWSKGKDVIAAFQAITAAQTGEAKLYGLQGFLRAVATVTSKTDLDDRISGALDSILENETIRAWVAGLLDSNVPYDVMTLEQVPEPVKLEFIQAGFDFATIMQIVAVIRSLIDLWKATRDSE